MNAFAQLDAPPAPCYVQLIQEPPAPFVHHASDASEADHSAPEPEPPATQRSERSVQGTVNRELVMVKEGPGGAQVGVIDSPRGVTRGGVGTGGMPDIGTTRAPSAADCKAGWMVLAGCDVPGHSAQVPLEKSGAELEAELLAAQRRQVMRLPEFENFAHFVLDACVFNLIEEATVGEERLWPPGGSSDADWKRLYAGL